MARHYRKARSGFDNQASFGDIQQYRELIDENPNLAKELIRYGPSKLGDVRSFVEHCKSYSSKSDLYLSGILAEGNLTAVQRHAIGYHIGKIDVSYKHNGNGRRHCSPRSPQFKRLNKKLSR
jgi:hypothetical protein